VVAGSGGAILLASAFGFGLLQIDEQKKGFFDPLVSCLSIFFGKCL
jgi:hypothetical protein